VAVVDEVHLLLEDVLVDVVVAQFQHCIEAVKIGVLVF